MTSPQVLRAEWPMLALFLAAAMTPVVFGDPFSLDLVFSTILWAAAATAWNISGGYAGQLSLGHAAFFGIGAYASTWLLIRHGVSPWVGMFVGGLLAAASAVAIGWLTMRLRGSFFVMATLAFGTVAHIVAVNWRSITGGSNGLSIPFAHAPGNMIFSDKASFVYVALALLVVTYALVRLIERSRLGYSLIAYRENDQAARALGVRTLRARLVAIAISAFLTALCGTVQTQYTLYIDPDSAVGLAFSLQVALIAIVGGLGTARGPIIGAMLIIPASGLLRAALSSSYSGVHLLVYSALVIIVLLTLPEGIGPGIARWWRKRAVRSQPVPSASNR